jgi:hypothetical protein
VPDFNQFGSTKPGSSGDPQHCAQCEAMLADALDGMLSSADRATFDLHLVGCPSCAAMVADAQRGAAWMEMLKSPRPEPPATLLARILAQTSDQLSTQTGNEAKPAIVLGPTDFTPTPHIPNTLLGRPTLASPAAFPRIAFAATNVIPFRSRVTQGLRALSHTMLQPRLAMTAAMAFFSIALTLNLTGVRLSELRASDLKPSSIVRSASQAKAWVFRYSDNLRVVYELESRVRDLQRSDDGSANTPAPQNAPAAQPGQKPTGNQQPQTPDQKQNRPRPKPGSSRRETPGNTMRLASSSQRQLNAAAQALVVFTPSVFKQEGGLV